MSSIIDYSWDFTKEDFSLDLDYFNEKEQEDKLWQARTGLNYETLCGAIETIIFMSDKPISILKIKNYIDSDLPLRVVHESIARLQKEYENKHHGIRLQEVALGYQFRTKATYAKIIQNIFKVQSMVLSPTALEVMAIIAYKQPISRTAIENIRGVDSSHIVRALMDKRLVKVVGRSDEIGKPALYGTTDEFLEVFNLADLGELPSETELTELATASSVGNISDIKSIVGGGVKKRFDYDELEELDELTEQIKQISADTLFTESLKREDKNRKDAEGHVKKSAFDILEDYVNKQETLKQNMISVESDILTNVMEPRSVDLTRIFELLNAPKLSEDEASSFDLSELPKNELSLSDDYDDSDIISLEEELDGELERSETLMSEAEELSEALDMAFDKLMGGKEEINFDVFEEEIDGSEFEELSEDLEAFSKSKAEMIEKAKELDIDLNFFQDELEQKQDQE